MTTVSEAYRAYLYAVIQFRSNDEESYETNVSYNFFAAVCNRMQHANSSIE